jgi:hypothetical protein
VHFHPDSSVCRRPVLRVPQGIIRAVSEDDYLLKVPTEADRAQMNALWAGIAGPGSYEFSPANRMDIWVIEQRLRAERLGAARLSNATWVLVAATVVMALAVIGQLIAALAAR